MFGLKKTNDNIGNSVLFNVQILIDKPKYSSVEEVINSSRCKYLEVNFIKNLRRV